MLLTWQDYVVEHVSLPAEIHEINISLLLSINMSDSDEDNIIRYGTPLEPFEEDEIPSKKKFQKDATDQFAVDDHGRRRFHGAFTGGFSAGYGNSVATPEGFTPATFKSSRSDKAKSSNQRPEDYMDEEDRSEFGIAPRLIQTKSDFSGQKRPHQARFHDGPIPGEPVLEQMIRAVHETAAVRMLKAMGWRPGQGTGERVTRVEKRSAAQRQKVYGCYIPRDVQQESNREEKSDSDSEIDYEALFAPDDYEPYILRLKNDRFGLGYSGLSRHSVLGSLNNEYGSEPGTSRSHLKMKDKGKKVSIRGHAFGVGALEDEDEDIYATEDMTHYDFSLGGPASDGGKKKAAKQTGVLEGFCRSSKPDPSPAVYPAPGLPRNYTPSHRTTRFEPTTDEARNQGLGRHELTAVTRGALLGETSTDDTQRKPSETASQTAQADPIQKLLGRDVAFVSTSDKEKTEDFISIKPVNDGVTKVFKPFASNPQKQLRYEKFLENKERAIERDGAMDNLSAWEKDREMLEFSQAAKLYKPLTGFMGDRFTHATETDEQPTNPLAAVAKSKVNKGLATKEQIEAASRGLYGVMTRTSSEWRPEPLVCKRFNVPHPYNDSRSEPTKEKSKLSFSIFDHLDTTINDKESFKRDQATFSGSKSLLDLPRPTNITSSIVNTPADSRVLSNNNQSLNEDPPKNKRMTVAELFLKESEKELQSNNDKAVLETIENFDRMELYKSIFLSDSETEEDATAKTDSAANAASYDDYRDIPKNVERNRSPPRGIFANIDFDELNAWRSRDSAEKKNECKDKATLADVSKSNELPDKSEHTEESVVHENDVYGPKIPDTLQKRLQGDSTVIHETEKGNFKPSFRSKNERDEAINIESSQSSDSWVEEKEVKSKKAKKKKSKKHKHKKSKHKKKS